MKSFMLILAAFFTLGMGPGDDDNNQIRKFDVKPGEQLEIDITTGGSISIEGWDKDVVEIQTFIRGADQDDYKITYDYSRGIVKIEAYYEGRGRHSGNVTFQIKVPQKFNIFSETMGGDINLKNIEGEIEGQTMGGNLKLYQLKGEIEMTTMGGDIDLFNSEVDGKLKTMGGDVVFSDVFGDIDGTTMGGDVNYRNVTTRSGENVGDEVKIKTMGGDIEVDEAPGGADVHTMGGDIIIKSAGEYVYAKTMGGDIEVEKLDGKIKATTMGGDIYVNVVGDGSEDDRDVFLSSMGGEIELTLPENISARFEIRLTYTRSSRQDYKIVSDFPLNIEEDGEWYYDDGSPRKQILGSGNVAGGTNTIRVETVNGNIRIKKGN